MKHFCMTFYTLSFIKDNFFIEGKQKILNYKMYNKIKIVLLLDKAKMDHFMTILSFPFLTCYSIFVLPIPKYYNYTMSDHFVPVVP